MSTAYQFTLIDPFGNKYKDLQVSRAIATLGENGVGTAELFLDARQYDYDDFIRDMILIVERSVDGAQPYLFGQKVWFLRRRQEAQEGDRGVLKLTFLEANCLLWRRLIAYFATEPEADKAQEADDMMRAIIRENYVTPTDTLRETGGYITVGPDVTLAPVIERAFAWEKVLQVLQGITQASYNLGTFLAFDLICAEAPNPRKDPKFVLDFRTYVNARGIDRRASGQGSVLIGPDFGNLRDWRLEDNWEEEETHVYAGGAGEDLLRLIEEATHPVLVGASPFGRIEGWFDDRDEDDAAYLQESAQADLQGGLTRTEIVGRFVDTPQLRWDVNFGLGDIVPVQIKGRVANCRVSGVQVDFSFEEAEVLTLDLAGLV